MDESGNFVRNDGMAAAKGDETTVTFAHRLRTTEPGYYAHITHKHEFPVFYYTPNEQVLHLGKHRGFLLNARAFAITEIYAEMNVLFLRTRSLSFIHLPVGLGYAFCNLQGRGILYTALFVQATNLVRCSM